MAHGIHLQYSFEARGQRGAELQNPLFDLLSALREHGSIRRAAEAMNSSYRHVWGALKHWEEVLGESLVVWTQGQPARLTPFAERLLWAEKRARSRLIPHIEALRSDLERVLAEARDGSQLPLTVFASHDLALPLLREHAAAQHGLHIELRFAGSVDALVALAAGRCVVAGFHVPALQGHAPVFAQALKPLLKPGHHKLIGSHRRTQGLMVRPGNPLSIRGLHDLPRVRFINRQAGSGTRLLTDHLLAAEGLAPERIAGYQSGPVEHTHVAVAAAVASGLGDAGLGIEAAAAEFGLHFIPLIEEDYFLVCLKEALDDPAVLRLRELLAGPAWPQALERLAGYEPVPNAGAVLPLTQALPWWHYRKPKPGRQASALKRA